MATEKTKIVKVQSNLPMMKCESFVIEDAEHIWVAESGKCLLADSVANKIRLEKGGDTWQRINQNLKRSNKKR